ncbi:MAG: hypothetical protein JNL84_11440 [Candidatus Accumulibacter sp.]|nr:hypothetical protein [Accumulibacter sp.]
MSVCANGCKWRALPEVLGHWCTVYTRMSRGLLPPRRTSNSVRWPSSMVTIRFHFWPGTHSSVRPCW